MRATPFLRSAAAAPACLVILCAPALAERVAGAAALKRGEREAAPVQTRAPAAASDRVQIAVTVDRAKVIRLPENTRMVVVGNPAIADVAMQRSGVVVVTGKSFGETNLIALDAGGNMLAESNVTVQAASEAIVTVQRGLERQSYSCTPSCQPAVQLGDASPYFASVKDQAQQHSQFSSQR
jgi:Flp pilus assembly secretin CpaC